MALSTDDRLELGRRLTRDVLDPMKAAFVGKDEVIDLLGVSLVAGENLFILGPPGTAKSALVQDLCRRLEGRMFDYLLTRFTEPNELFGPFDIRKLREGDLVTNTEGMLPEASLVFLDELLNANSAILNSLLMVLNERVFRRGRETRKLPLLMVVGASNRLPEDEALGALFDRFLLRVQCDNVPEERLADVVEAGWKLDVSLRSTAPLPPTVSIDDIRELQMLTPAVDLSGVREAYCDLVLKVRRAGVPLSDRRTVKLQRLLAASALISGRTKVILSDLWIFRHLWDREEQREVLAALVQNVLDGLEPSADAHPRARALDRPDPESLARDLETLQTRLGEPQLGEADRSRVRDQLGALAGRIEWVADAQQRQFLKQKLTAIWPLVRNTAAEGSAAS